jgi:membrane-bound ClpP family serine protease
MKVRFIWSIISTILEEAAIVAAVLWGLPRIDIMVPIPVMIVIMVAWLAFSIFTYRKGTHALMRKPIPGLANMTGSKGRVVKTLSPNGMVRIKGELWDAISVSGNMDVGEYVEVLKQEGLRLIVKKL